MTVGDAVVAAAQRLAAAGVPTPRVDAELLVCAATGWSRARLKARGDAALPDDVAGELEATLRRREAREPLQLIVGQVGFRYVDLEVRPGVFIPRPETEVLAGLAVERTPDGGVVVEPCTGTGAIACAVATEARPSAVVATDISADAVALARANAERTGAGVTVMQGDLLDPVPSRLRGAVDVLVCNPPYIAAGETDAWEPEVRWDPPAALVSGSTGDEVADRLIRDAGHWLRPGGWLLLEVDAARAHATAARLRDTGFGAVAVTADLAGRERFVAGCAPGGLSQSPPTGESGRPPSKENH